MTRFRTLVAVIAFCAILSPAAAEAHKPEFLPAQAAPKGKVEVRLGNGTTSYAVYGAVATPRAARTVTFHLAKGDLLYVEMLIPANGPEQNRPCSQLPTVTLTGPIDDNPLPCTRVGHSFFEPFSFAHYRTIMHYEQKDAPGGLYTAVITSPKPARFSFVVGNVERFGAGDFATMPTVVGKSQAWYHGSASNVADGGRVALWVTIWWLIYLAIPIAIVGGITWLIMRGRRRRRRRREASDAASETATTVEGTDQ